ncbi:MAG TPA: hypothetical protein VFR70_06360, partial [Flavobacterium sp.]|nr:hypothetical protein [Flavobacterium sp.]
YQNIFKEFYVVVIDEPKKNFQDAAQKAGILSGLDGYYAILKSGLQQSLQNASFQPVKDISVGGMKAKNFIVEGEAEAIPIYYNFACIEGKDRFYQIIVWTIKKHKERYADAMQKIIESFEEAEIARNSRLSKK